MRILIAEDDRVSQRILAAALGRYGVCTVASGGAEALELFESSWSSNQSFGLVCLDISMPELSGIEVAKRIRGFEIQRGVPATEHVPIVIATGLEDDRYFLAAHEAGSSWYLRKPVERAALEALMGDLGIQPIASSR